MNFPQNELWMRQALACAEEAGLQGEVPIGAVAVVGEEIVARAYNIREASHNPLGHAEILLLEKLAREQKSWRLTDVTLVVTCEPCLMCMGALLQARIPKLIYGCKDPKAGACGSLYDVSNDARLNHRIIVESEVLANECGKLLSQFFKKLRV